MSELARLIRKSPFFIVTLLVLAKAELFRFTVFSGTSPRSLIIDLLSALLISCIIELIPHRRVRQVLYGVYWLIATLTLLGATVYFRYFGSVATYTTLFELNQLPAVKSSVKSLITPLEALYFADLVLFAIGWGIHLWKKRRDQWMLAYEQVPAPFKLPYSVATVLVSIALIFSVFTVRASADTTNELKRAELVGFTNYQASVLWNAFSAKREKPDVALKDIPATKEKLEEQVVPAFASSSSTSTVENPAYFGSEKGKNLIMVQLEATQNFVIGLSVAGQEITPVMNGLVSDSFYFPQVFQQIGQGNTSDAEFMSNTSIYPTAAVAMSKGYSDKDLPSLPKLLGAQGYTTMTLHPNDVTFWDRDKLYPALGFSTYYDKPFFTNDHFNSFGASDEELYRVGLEKIKEASAAGKPFYAQFVSLSSHHPFEIPEDKQELTLPEDIAGTQLGNYLQAVHYTDKALGKLIQGLKDQGLWDNTILVLYGDHFGLQAKDNDPADVSKKLGIDYHSQITRFSIPLIIHAPGQEGKRVERTGGQVDILPTVANLLGLSWSEDEFVPFGRDLLNAERNVVGMRYYLPTGSFYNDEILFIPGTGFEDGTAYSLKTHEKIEDFSKYKGDYEYILEWMKLSDEYVKQLPKHK
ncbi:LTA synthase family protein [Gorillibacterium timonense]|uniref:LTA synthase family protein n=1 Tax=Gorillibacterium timonense TaxID=1689269 RepID=UPI00071C818C|nr:LTA synthase family protein [Gorillibacterium timonense]